MAPLLLPSRFQRGAISFREVQMLSAQQEVERLLSQIRERVKDDPVVVRASDQIEVLCRGYMETPEERMSDEVSWRWKLTRSEAAYFELLYTKIGQVVTRDAMYDAAYWRKLDGPAPKIIDVLICKMRKKMKACNADFWIETIVAVGYRLRTGKCPEVTVSGTGRYMLENVSKAAWPT